MKDWENINLLKNMIENYEDADTAFEEGVVRGLYYAVNLLEHGKEYANQRIKMPRKNNNADGKECGC